MRAIALIAAAALCTASAPRAPAATQQAADGGALAAVERLVALNAAGQLQSAEGKALFTGELAEFDDPSIGPLTRPDASYALADGEAVVRLPASDAWRWDLYLFLDRTGPKWQVRAIRLLAIPVLLANLRDQLRAQSQPTAEDAATLRNLDLVFSTDRELRGWFERHRGEVEALRAAGKDAREAAVKRFDAGRFAESPEGLPMLTIGGLLDNEVGFLFVGEGKPPPIEASAYIWVEPVGGGWYLFRTT